jgi:hypothetical protein
MSVFGSLPALQHGNLHFLFEIKVFSINMELRELIKSRAHRNLKRLPRYYDLHGDKRDKWKTPLDELSLVENEQLIGVYENSADEFNHNIVVSTDGMRIFQQNSWIFIPYSQIRQSKVYLTNIEHKTSADTIEISLVSGEKLSITIKGGEGNLRDVWSFERYICHVVNDSHKA